VRAALRLLHYDLAGGSPAGLLPALLGVARTDRLLYGSDYPFTPGARVRELAALLRATDLLTEPERQDVRAGNPARLLGS
jgi:hypothetical protein